MVEPQLFVCSTQVRAGRGRRSPRYWADSSRKGRGGGARGPRAARAESSGGCGRQRRVREAYYWRREKEAGSCRPNGGAEEGARWAGSPKLARPAAAGRRGRPGACVNSAEEGGAGGKGRRRGGGQPICREVRWGQTWNPRVTAAGAFPTRLAWKGS